MRQKFKQINSRLQTYLYLTLAFLLGFQAGGPALTYALFTASIAATGAAISTAAIFPPPAPANLDAVAIAGGSIELSWTATSASIDGYEMYRSISPGGSPTP